MTHALAPSHVRHRVVAVTALMSVLLYLDRFCISFAEGFIKDDLNLTDVQVGWMLSAFFWTYALGQVPSGWLADRFGARLMLTLYVLLWSLFTGLTGLAFGFAVLMLLRFGFGFSQAGAYPTGANILSKWVPFAARGIASSLVTVGGRVGGFLALFATGYVIVWLTPRTTPTDIQPPDILRGPQLCFELLENGKPDSPGAGRLVLANLPLAVRETIDRQSALFAADRAARQAAEAARIPPDASFGQRFLANFRPSTAIPPLATLPPDEQAALAAALTAIVNTPGFFNDEHVRGLPLEKEARRLIRMDLVDRTDEQSRRLNRLVLESLHREPLRKLYMAGWRPMMLVYGAIGLIVAGMIWYICRDRPADHPRCNAAEIALIENDPRMAAVAKREKIGGVPFVRLLTSTSMWLDALTQWFTNIGWIFVMTWAPRYFDKVHQVPVEQRAWMVAIPPLIGWFGMVSGGALTDWLVPRIGLRWGRALPISLSRFLAMAAYLVCLADPSPWFAVAMFSIVTFATDLGTPAQWAFKQDVGGRHVGSILGWGNMWGNLGAAVTPPFLIALVGPNQNWSAAFLASAIAFFLAGVAALGINATIPIVPDESHSQPSGGG